MAETLLATDPTTALPQPVLGTRLTQAAQAAQARRTAQTDRLCTWRGRVLPSPLRRKRPGGRKRSRRCTFGPGNSGIRTKSKRGKIPVIRVPV